MNASDLKNYVSVTSSRLATISRALFGDVPVDFTDDQVERVEAVVTFMRKNKEGSVKRAVQRMTSPSEVHESDRVTSATSSAAGAGSFYDELNATAEALATECADALEAEVWQRITLKFGSGTGLRAQAMREQFSQSLLPQAPEGNDRGFLPSSTSMPLLSASQAS